MATTKVFLPHIASPTWSPSDQRLSWTLHMPNMPNSVSINGDGMFWMMQKGADTIPDLEKLGVSHFTRADIARQFNNNGEQIAAYRNSGHGYDDVPQTQTMFAGAGGGPNIWVGPYPGAVWPNVWNRSVFNTPEGAAGPLTYEQGKMYGERYSTDHSLIIFENSEGDHAISTHWDMVRGFCDGLMPRMEERWGKLGIKYCVCWNYFSGFGVSLGHKSRAEHKQFLKDPTSSWGGYELLNGNLQRINGTCFGLYLGSPDQVQQVPYDLIYNSYVNHKAGKYLIPFFQGTHEWLPNGFMEVRYPDGKLYVRQKPLHDINAAFSYVFYGMTFADGFAGWSMGGRTTSEFVYDEYYSNGAKWFPNEATSEQPLSTCPHIGGNINFCSPGIENIVGFARKYYFNTTEKTKGGTEQWLDFQIDGGAWINAANDHADDIVDAQFDQRGFMWSRRKGDTISFVYGNAYADNLEHDLKWRYAGIEYVAKIAGNCPYAVNHSL